MHSILSYLKQSAKRQEGSFKSFGMLHCASFIQSTLVEGDQSNNAFAYIQKIVALTNQAIGDELNDSQKRAVEQILEDLIQFNVLCATTRETNPDKLIDLLKIKLSQRDCVYLPAGWKSITNGHYVTLKVQKADQGQLKLCYLNHGAGIENHPILAETETKTKRDYCSYSYQFAGTDSDSLKLFVQGLLGMNNLDAVSVQRASRLSSNAGNVSTRGYFRSPV